MGYVSHIFMYMDIRKHINLIKNHGYEGKIGMIKKDVHGIVICRSVYDLSRGVPCLYGYS